MMIFLFIINTNTFGIGIGIYPHGFLSVKFFPKDKFFLQLTIGIKPYYAKHIYEKTIAYTFGGRFGYNLFERETRYYNYAHFIGVGTGIYMIREIALEKMEIIPITNIFYEFNLFPTKKVNFALEPNLGINFIRKKELHFFMGGGTHFYF